MPTLEERCRGIVLLVVDVDGVLTEGGIVHGSTGLELKQFHVRDGSGLKVWHQAGKHSALITGRTSPVVETRAVELGITRARGGRGAVREVVELILRCQGVWQDVVERLHRAES